MSFFSHNKKSLAYNTTFSLIDKSFYFLTSIFIIPFIISKLGVEQYGAWVLFGAVSSYFMLAQFGVSSSFKKYISEFNALGEYDKVSRFFNTAFFLMVIIVALINIIGFVLGPYIIDFFFKNNNFKSLQKLFIYFLGISSLGLINEIFTSLPQGYQRFDLTSINSIICRIVYIISVFIFLGLNFSLNGLILSTLISNLLMIILNGFICFGLLKIKLSFFKFDFQMLKNIFNFGIKIQFSYLASWIASNFDKILIAKFLGVEYTAIYDMGSRLVILIREFPYVIINVIMPHMSELHASKKNEELIEFYHKGSKLFFIICCTLISVLIPVSERVLQIWLHTSVNPLSIYTFNILLIGSTLQLTTGIPGTLLKSIGKPGSEAIANGIFSATNILLSSILLYIFGFKGVVWGTSIGFLTGCIILFYFTNKILSISNLNFFFKIAFIPLAIDVVVGCTGYLLNSHFNISTNNLAINFIYVIVYSILMTAINLYFFRLTKYATSFKSLIAQ